MFMQKFAVLQNGIRMPYLEKGDTTGTALIMLHGIADSCRAFEPILPCISEHIHAFAVTLRGHGDASRPESGYSTDDFAEDLRLFMDALEIDNAVILGASSGGFPARRFAVKYPERVAGLILLGSPSALRENPMAQALWNSTVSRITDPVDTEFVRRFSQGIISDKIPGAFFESMLEENMKLPARVWRGTFEGIMQETFPGDIEKIIARTLIIWGDQDAVIDRKDQEELSKAIWDSRLVVLSGLGHLLYWEEPERVAEEINAFMENIED